MLPLLKFYKDPFEYIYMLRLANKKDVNMKIEDEHYELTYKDENGDFAKQIEEEFEVQIGAEFLHDPEMEGFIRGMNISDITYSITVDQDTYLPTESKMYFNIDAVSEGEDFSMNQIMVFDYLEFDPIDSIEVPEEVSNQAVSFDEVY